MDVQGPSAIERVAVAYDGVSVRRKAAAPVQAPTGNAADEQPPAGPGRIDPEELQRVITEANKSLRESQCYLQFSIDQSTKTMVVKLIDGQSGEVIRQMPPDEILRIRAYYRELNGLLVDRAV